jgi:uncharacterized membrane-anchored protein YitT (DUF2179 family)
MMKKFLGVDKIEPKVVLKNLFIIILGSIITAVGINAFLMPHKFLSCGVSGLAQFFAFMTPLEVGTYVIIFNIPIFLLGWKYVGRVFIVGSFIGTITLSLCLYATNWMIGMGWAPDPLLAAIVGGALSGAGTGLVFRVNSSHGGTDIIAAAVKKKWSFSIGTVVFMFNIVIVGVLGFVYGVNVALYTIVAYFISAIALDRVIIGLDTSRAIFIITNKPEEVADKIIKKLERGVTFLDGAGAYMGRKQRVLYCVVPLRQLARVKHYVSSIDPDAFLTVTEVSEVMGQGFRAVPI